MPDENIPGVGDLRIVKYNYEEVALRAGEQYLRQFPLGEGWRVEIQECGPNNNQYYWWLSHTEVDCAWEVSLRRHHKDFKETYHVASVTYQDHGADCVSNESPWEAIDILYKDCLEAVAEFVRQATPATVVSRERMVPPEAEVEPVSVWEHLKEE